MWRRKTCKIWTFLSLRLPYSKCCIAPLRHRPLHLLLVPRAPIIFVPPTPSSGENRCVYGCYYFLYITPSCRFRIYRYHHPRPPLAASRPPARPPPFLTRFPFLLLVSPPHSVPPRRLPPPTFPPFLPLPLGLVLLALLESSRHPTNASQRQLYFLSVLS